MWKSKGLSDESIKFLAASLAPALNCINTKTWIKFDGSCLKQEKVTFTQKQGVNIYIFYETNLWQFNVGKNFALRSSLFGAVKLNINKYKYSSYGIGFDARGCYSLSDGSKFGRNVIKHLALIWFHWCILLIRKMISWFLVQNG